VIASRRRRRQAAQWQAEGRAAALCPDELDEITEWYIADEARDVVSEAETLTRQATS
jgi:hypothetical protein